MGLIWIVLAIAAGLATYWFRCWNLFYYGACEIVVAVAVIFLTVYPQSGTALITDQSVPSAWGVLLSKSVGISAGIYIMVRGLDNIDKGRPWPKWLPRNWDSLWSRVFHSKRSSPECDDDYAVD
jgi:hypothetical protein